MMVAARQTAEKKTVGDLEGSKNCLLMRLSDDFSFLAL